MTERAAGRAEASGGGRALASAPVRAALAASIAMSLAGAASPPVKPTTAATSGGVVRPDREAAMARARAIRDRVSRGDMSGLWGEFSDRMKTVLKDSASYVAMSAGIHAQLGALDSVMSEEVSQRDTMLVVLTRCRFEKLPIPANLTVGFTSSGQIGTLNVRPDANQEFPSKYLDYVPKARFELPFKGEWWVAWGGRTAGENHHAWNRAQRFAHDLCVVKDGKTHAGDGKALTDYYCYGQPILAPAAGVVVATLDSLPDQPIGSRDPARAAGNHVVIDHGNGEYSLLAHLKPRSLRVRIGDRVKTGDVVGLTGNSGNTTQPHLHVHLMNKPSMDDADGLPMPFSDYVLDDKRVESGELKRFQIVKPRVMPE